MIWCQRYFWAFLQYESSHFSSSTKTTFIQYGLKTCFSYSNLYPPIPLNSPEPFGGGIKYKALTSSWSVYGYLLEVGSFLFSSPLSASVVRNPIFDIKSNEDKTKTSTPMLSVSGKNSVSFSYWDTSAFPKSSGGGFAAYPRTSVSGGFQFGSSTGRSEFETSPKIRTENVSGELLVIFPIFV